MHWIPEQCEGGRGTPDLVWLAEAGRTEPRPVIVSADGRILRNAAERAALRSTGLTFVHLSRGWANTPWDEYVPKLTKFWPKIVREVRLLKRPAVLEVAVGGGKVKQVGFTADLSA